MVDGQQVDIIERGIEMTTGTKGKGMGDITYRQIAKMFAGAIPSMGDAGGHKQGQDKPLRPVVVTQEKQKKPLTAAQLKAVERQSAALDRVEHRLDDEQAEYSDRVEAYIVAIRAMSIENRHAIRAAYIFSRKAPKEEREDLFQELMVKLLEVRAPTEALAYTIARCDWRDWWKSYRTRAGFVETSLNSVVLNNDGDEVEYGELLVGEVEFERLVDGKLDGQAIWDHLPDYIKRLVSKRLTGRGITGGERIMLDKFVITSGLLAR